MILKNSSVEAAFLKSESSPARVVLPGAMEQVQDPPALSLRIVCRESLDWRVRKILLFVDAEDGKVGSDMTEICGKLDLGISADYAVKLFKRQTGIGFREYAAHKRLIRAANQLTQTSLSIKVIAADLGYNSPQDFSRRFKFQYQVKPTEFRKQRHL
jgi:methylphosphotriester-DNA--protein-cysteine methyltransferase